MASKRQLVPQHGPKHVPCVSGSVDLSNRPRPFYVFILTDYFRQTSKEKTAIEREICRNMKNSDLFWDFFLFFSVNDFFDVLLKLWNRFLSVAILSNKHILFPKIKLEGHGKNIIMLEWKRIRYWHRNVVKTISYKYNQNQLIPPFDSLQHCRHYCLEKRNCGSAFSAIIERRIWWATISDWLFRWLRLG